MLRTIPVCNNENECKLRNQLINALELADLGMWEWQVSTRRVDLNQASYRLLGIDENEESLDIDFFATIIHEESMMDFQDSLIVAEQTGHLPIKTYRINHPSRETCYIRIKSQTSYGDGKPTVIRGVLMDVTDTVIAHHDIKKELEFIDSLIQILPHPFFYKSSDGLYRYFNQAFIDYLGLDYEQVMNKSVYDVAPSQLADIYKAADDALLTSQGIQTYEAKVRYSDGQLHDVIFTKTVHIDEKGQSLGLIGMMQDVTEQRLIENRLKKTLQVKDILLSLNHELINFTEKKSFMHEILTRCSKLFTTSNFSILAHISHHLTIELYDADRVKVMSSVIKDLQDSYVYKATGGDFSVPVIVNDLSLLEEPDNATGKTIITNNKIQSAIVIPVNVESKAKWVLLYLADTKHAFDSELLIVAKRLKDELEVLLKTYSLYQETLRLSRFDGLTDVLNRQYFDEKLEAVIKEGRSNFKVAIFDLDKLKVINDSLGHAMGDWYLQTLARLLKRHIKRGDLIGRIGGDEFAAILMGKEDYKTLFEVLRRQFSEIVFDQTKGTFKGSFSYGISSYPEDGKTYKRLLKTADQRMYLYKNR